jgi:hypothetical protein
MLLVIKKDFRIGERWLVVGGWWLVVVSRGFANRYSILDTRCLKLDLP